MIPPLTDRDHGASVVASELLRALALMPPREATREALAAVARQPDMAPLAHIVDLCVRAWKGQMDGPRWERELEAYRFAIDRETQAAAHEAARVCGALAPDQIAVLSHSGSVLLALRMLALAGHRVPLLCMESRPRCEGRETAREARSLGFRVTVCTDAALDSVVTDGTMALVGCDRLGRWKARNKIGTHAMVRAVLARGGWVVMVAGPDKILDDEIPWPPPSGGPPVEVWPEAPGGVRVVNPYFEDFRLPPPLLVAHARGVCTASWWPRVMSPPQFHPATLPLLREAMESPAGPATPPAGGTGGSSRTGEA